MARAKQPKQIHQMTIPEWEAAFPDEDACCLYLANIAGPSLLFARAVATPTSSRTAR